MRRGPTVEELVAGVRARDRMLLARAITLLESTRPADEREAQAVLAALASERGNVRRVGISGAPGVGKSTFVEALGLHLVEDLGLRLAVLAVDPSSPVTGGSILGDKARMHRLAQHERAFVRPSPSAATLGGVARRTRECMALLEAFGCDVILVETVGVGQSEVAVADLVDFFLLLVQPGAGDELQGIKKGVVELADGFAVTKADGDLEAAAERAARQLSAALGVLGRPADRPAPFVRTTAALAGRGVGEVWEAVEAQIAEQEAQGALAERRRDQLERWLWERVDEELRTAFREHPAVKAALGGLVEEVRGGRRPPTAAALDLLGRFGVQPGKG